MYAVILTLQNRKARGNDRYALNSRPKGVEWASQNMFVLGLIVILFMILHFTQFWYNMMFAELAGIHGKLSIISGMVCCIMVPPDSRFLVSNPHIRLEQHCMVEPLGMHF